MILPDILKDTIESLKKRYREIMLKDMPDGTDGLERADIDGIIDYLEALDLGYFASANRRIP